MCKWRRVRLFYTKCGHGVNLPDEEIKCESTTCIFSPNHPNNCGPNCKRTCWQYHQYPEQFTRQIQDRCAECKGLS
ncbi:hypothetical protein K474DRAFT_1655177 [Panus rudis PR-1116 ss-1]|nr:hypothetical protein K474DRAFT_1655177 [Panus rudis PR-1116 ss-1]